MSEIAPELINHIQRAICIQLGFDEQRPPLHISKEQVSQILGVRPGTLNTWASTGRYNRPFVKCGRLRRYSLHEVAAFIAKRTMSHVGHVKGGE